MPLSVARPAPTLVSLATATALVERLRNAVDRRQLVQREDQERDEPVLEGAIDDAQKARGEPGEAVGQRGVDVAGEVVEFDDQQ